MARPEVIFLLQQRRVGIWGRIQMMYRMMLKKSMRS